MNNIIINLAFVALILLLFIVLILLREKNVAVSIMAIILFCAGCFLQIRGAGGTFLSYCDLFNFVGMLLFAVPLLFLSGRADDFILALRVAFTKHEADIKSLKKAKMAVILLERLVTAGAFVTFMIGALSMMNFLEDLTAIRPNLAIALLPFLYALIICSLLKCLCAVIEAKIIEQDKSERV